MSGDKKSHTKVNNGLPPRDDVLELLNEAYEGWGSQDLFRWKYDQYPGFDANTHCFYIERDGELAAFRRVFEKRVKTPEGDIPMFILGDTAVGTDFRGQGLYSALHRETTGMFENEGVISTFNRVGNITYEANRKRGWKFRTLPLHIRILDYSHIIGQYATNVAPPGSRLYSLLRLVDRYPGLRTIGGNRIRLSDATITSDDLRSLALPVPKGVLNALVQTAATPSPTHGLVDSLTNILERGTVTRRPHQVSQVTDPEPMIHDLVEGCSLRETTFARTENELNHLLRYPDADLLVSQDGDEITGFAVIGPKHERHTTEGRILDFHAESDVAESSLIAALEIHGHAKGYDTLVATVPIDRSNWITVQRQVLMWDPETASDFSEEWLRQAKLGLYDTL